VTGSWADGEDAAKLLADDGITLSFNLLLSVVLPTTVNELCRKHY